MVWIAVIIYCNFFNRVLKVLIKEASLKQQNLLGSEYKKLN